MRKLIVLLLLAVILSWLFAMTASAQCTTCSTIQRQVTIEKTKVWNPALHPRDPATGRFIKRIEPLQLSPIAVYKPLYYRPYQPVRNALRATGNGLRNAGHDLRVGLHFILAGPR